MRIHHFYPRTRNIGDHFVGAGIHSLVRRFRSDATFELFDVNSRGLSDRDYGLTREAIERANKDADLVIVGGSNLYEGAVGWSWGVQLDPQALEDLRVPLFLVGVGTGSAFASPVHRPNRKARTEIKLLNHAAALSWARDVVTLEWLRELGISKAEMLGDPATFLFNSPYQMSAKTGYTLIVVPPSRIWSNRRGFLNSTRFGRPIFRAMVELSGELIDKGEQVVVACNDPHEFRLTKKLFAKEVVCPVSADEYFRLLRGARAVLSGRLHTAAVALSMGIPFLIFDLDQRTHGFIRTYELEHASLPLSVRQSGAQTIDRLLNWNHDAWINSLRVRDDLYRRAMERLGEELALLSA